MLGTRPGMTLFLVEPSMSPDLLFWLALALKMAVTAGFVIAAAMVAERAGAAIGAIVATLPIAAGPAYVFVGLDHDSAFISASAIGSIAAHAATAVFSLVYIVLAQRAGLVLSVGGAVAVWFVVAFMLRSVSWSFLSVAAANLALFGVCIALTHRYRFVKMPMIGRKWFDIPVRAFLVACLVAAVVGLSGHVGPTMTGLLAVYPIVTQAVGAQAKVIRCTDSQHHVGAGRLQRLPVHGASGRDAIGHLGRTDAVACCRRGVESRAVWDSPPRLAAARYSILILAA